MPFVNFADQNDGSQSDNGQPHQLARAFRQVTDSSRPVRSRQYPDISGEEFTEDLDDNGNVIVDENENGHQGVGMSLFLHLHLATTIHPFIALVIKNLKIARVPWDYICELCQLSGVNHDEVALNCAEGLHQVAFGAGRNEEYIFSNTLGPWEDRYTWMDQVHRGENVNLADYPGLTHNIIIKYWEHLQRKRDLIEGGNHGVDLMPIHLEYTLFYTGIPLDMIPDNLPIDAFTQYANALEAFYDVNFDELISSSDSDDSD